MRATLTQQNKQLLKEVTRACCFEQQERLIFSVCVVLVLTLSGPSAAARTGKGAERFRYERVEL